MYGNYGVRKFYGPFGDQLGISGVGNVTRTIGEGLMPFMPLIGAGASILGGAINAFSQGSTNRKQQQFAIDMYNRQRQDALSDWQMMNTYNAPSAQMERLKAAGLNPNLVYGNGATATTGSMPRSSSASTPALRAPEFGTGIQSSITDAMGLSIQSQQLENMKSQQKVMDATTALKEIEGTMKVAATAGINTRIKVAETMLPLMVASSQAHTQQSIANTQYTLTSMEWIAAKNSASISQALENVAYLRLKESQIPVEIERAKAFIDNLKTQGSILKDQLGFWDKGINPNDPAWMRVISTLIDKYLNGNDEGNPVNNMTPKTLNIPSNPASPFFGFPKY